MYTLSYKKEAYRKLVHLSSIIYPIIYIFLNQNVFLYILISIFCFLFIWDILRIKGIYIKSLSGFNKILRSEETIDKKLTGATHFFLSMIIVTIFFPKTVVILSILILVICDSAAALIGRKYPIIKFNLLNKSLGGFLGYLLFGLVAIYLYYITLFDNYNVTRYAFLALLFSAIVELFAKKFKIDDNLLITLSFATVYNLGY